MRASFIFTALLSAFAAAYTTPVGDTPSGNPISRPGLNEIVPVGTPYVITWTPTTEGTVTLVLLRGPSTNIKPLYAIVEKIPNTGSYAWTPATDLEADVTHYGIQLIVDSNGQYQYTTQFGISNPNPQPSSSIASSSATSPSAVSSSAVSSSASSSSASSSASSSTGATVTSTVQLATQSASFTAPLTTRAFPSLTSFLSSAYSPVASGSASGSSSLVVVPASSSTSVPVVIVPGNSTSTYITTSSFSTYVVPSTRVLNSTVTASRSGSATRGVVTISTTASRSGSVAVTSASGAGVSTSSAPETVTTNGAGQLHFGAAGLMGVVAAGVLAL